MVNFRSCAALCDVIIILAVLSLGAWGMAGTLMAACTSKVPHAFDGQNHQQPASCSNLARVCALVLCNT
jgi:hypothetical protein